MKELAVLSLGVLGASYFYFKNGGSSSDENSQGGSSDFGRSQRLQVMPEQVPVKKSQAKTEEVAPNVFNINVEAENMPLPQISSTPSFQSSAPSVQSSSVNPIVTNYLKAVDSGFIPRAPLLKKSSYQKSVDFGFIKPAPLISSFKTYTPGDNIFEGGFF